MANIQSVERAFAVLRALSSGTLGVSEIAERVDLPKSTVSRLLTTLVDLEAVERAELAGGYSLGTLVVDLANSASPEGNLVAIARPVLQELVDELGEAAGLSMLDGNVVYYYDQIEGEQQEVQVRDWTGESVDFHVVASGLVLAAYADADTQSALLAEPLERWTDRSTTDPRELAVRFEQIRRGGHAWTREEMSEGLDSVAAPVRNAAGTVVAAVHAHGPSYRFPAARTERIVAEQVTQAANRISDRLAGRLTDAHQSLTA